MFKRGNNARTENEKNSTNSSEEKSEKNNGSIGAGDKASAIPVRSRNDEKTIIGEGVIIEGTIRGAGNLIIEGVLKGNVELAGNSITVGPKGRIEGEIIAKDAVINGALAGPDGGKPFPNSNHAGVVNVVFCDSAAKSISEDIDVGVYSRLITPAGDKPFRNVQPQTPLNGTEF